MSDVDVVVVGAGAAGIGAAKTLQRLGKTFRVLEASHRIGGRAYTEEVRPGMPFDLGCHWMHSASLNPSVDIAAQLAIAYTQEGYHRSAFDDESWHGEEDIRHRMGL